MAAIYNNAYVVIGSDKSKDSNGGFLKRDAEIESCHIAIVENSDGSRSEVRARQHEQQGNFVTRFSSCNSPLASRAWTLQEQLLYIADGTFCRRPLLGMSGRYIL